MELKVLGCYGSQAPGYATSAFLIGDSILMDAGSVTTQLELKEQSKIRSVLISHAHIDHAKGILFMAENLTISPSAAYGRNSHPIRVYSSAGVVSSLKTHLLNWEIWPDFSQIPDARHPLIQFKKIPLEKFFRIEGRRVLAFKSNHSVEAVGFCVEGSQGWLVYSGDTGPNPRMWKVANSLNDLKAIIVDVSFPNRMEELALLSGHLTPKLLQKELQYLKNRKVRVFVSHMKPPYLGTLGRELKMISNPRVNMLSPGTRIRF